MDYGLSYLHSEPQPAIDLYRLQMVPKRQLQLGYHQWKQHKDNGEQCRILPLMYNCLDKIS
jgi:hypothetical protein